ncbi:hypothetical protein HPP92_006837 [Vanilla planifolia]|uniref:Uncharacterized protein n=1 Tax=Vanilla planifolia TaxID=51239 RepID=A0A835RF71_VANPL|nr:hypothetical protein HPP92_006837 [Vanilla planifolia]
MVTTKMQKNYRQGSKGISFPANKLIVPLKAFGQIENLFRTPVGRSEKKSMAVAADWPARADREIEQRKKKGTEPTVPSDEIRVDPVTR